MRQIIMTNEQYKRQLAWTRKQAKYKLLKKMQKFVDIEMKKLGEIKNETRNI